MCIHSRLIKNRRYIPNKKNGGKVPPFPLGKDGRPDKRVAAVPIGCGKCIECLKKKGREYAVRLAEDIRHNKNAVFITLTFSTESIKKLAIHSRATGYQLDNDIATKAVELFRNRWKKKYKKEPRHWLVTELGHTGTEHIHLHGLIWTDEIDAIDERWGYGYTWIGDEKKGGYVNEQTINYITKYLSKVDKDHRYYKPIVLGSKGIGNGYMKRHDAIKNRYNEGGTDESYTTRQGYRTALPVYYRNKIYTEDEKEKLWQEKLDEKVRYVNGKKIDISKGTEVYYRELKAAQEKNKRLGYGGEFNWSEKEYEEQRRNMLNEKRIEREITNEINYKKELPRIEAKDAF